MKYKKRDLVKVIKLKENDAEEFGIKEGETYKVISVCDYCVEIDLGKDGRWMFHDQVEIVKKKSKKDLRIEELENTIKQMKDILNK